MPKPTPGELWMQAGEDGERYRALLLEHGLLIPLKPGEKPQPLPCGWMPGRKPAPQPTESTGWVCAMCNAPGRLGQQCEQCGGRRCTDPNRPPTGDKHADRH